MKTIIDHIKMIDGSDMVITRLRMAIDSLIDASISISKAADYADGDSIVEGMQQWDTDIRAMINDIMDTIAFYSE